MATGHDPMMCDAAGRELAVGQWVKLRDDVEEHPDNVGDRVGEIVSLPPRSSEWYGFPYVRFVGTRKPHHVANSAVLVVKRTTGAEVNTEALRTLRDLAAQYRADDVADPLATLAEAVELIEQL